MNPGGHPKTLVAAQPGNKNALKTGLFSPDLVASRVEETERALAPLDPEELISEVLKSEIARFIVLRDAMDRALEDGLGGRGGQPKNMINLRLRTNTRLLKTIEQFESRPRPAASDRSLRSHESVAGLNVLDEIARRHKRESIDLIAPEEFDPPRFLVTIADSDDPTVNVNDQIRAHRLWTRWRAGRSPLCACFSTRAARDGAEFRGWMDELSEGGLTPHDADTGFADCVRALARGERLEPLIMYARTSVAIEAVVGAALEHAGLQDRTDNQSGDEPLNAFGARLWRTMLSADDKVSLRQRLQAFDALEKADAFRPCTCGGLEAKRLLAEEELDLTRAYVVRLVAGRHYRAAAAAVQFPETYLAVRDAIDAAIRSRRNATEGESP